MRVVAFDVGVRNLAWCVMDDAGEIRAWRNAGLEGRTIEANVRSMHELLATEPFEVDVVLIERQTGANTRMICLASALLMHFLPSVPRVEFVDTRHKLTGLPDLPPAVKLPGSVHRRNKVEAIERVGRQVSGTWADMFQNANKKDDLADCYAYACSFLERERAIVL